MKKKDIYFLLEEKLLGYLDLIGVPIHAIEEELVPITDTSYLIARPINEDMLPYTGKKIYVRKNVLEKLSKAALELHSQDASMALEVVYGYRTNGIQTRLFEEYRKNLKQKLSGTALLQAVHKFIASPDVAGHHTGGAVDVQILKNGEPIDFRTKIWEFTHDSFTFSPFISKEAWQNRQLLRRLMLKEGFAPYDGEWWHFSYGDKEWAKYFSRSFAIYDQLDFEQVKIYLKKNRSKRAV